MSGISKYEGSTIGLDEVKAQLDEIKKEDVSEVARSKGQFIDQLKKAGSVSKLPKKWKDKREGFIARHMEQYNKNPTYRRWLALVAWAYKPKIKHE